MEESTVTATVDRYLREEIYPESTVVMSKEETKEQKLKDDIEQMARTLVLRVLMSSDDVRDSKFYKSFTQDVLKMTKGR